MNSMTKFAVSMATSLVVSPAFCVDITGQRVVGDLSFDYSHNIFLPGAPAYGDAIATVGNGVEFSYSDAANTITANFTGTQLIIEDIIAPGASTRFWRMTFDSMDIQLVSSTFSGYVPSAMLSGLTFDTTYSWSSIDFGGSTDGNHAYRAVFDITSFNASAVPEPASAALMLAGLLLVSRRCGAYRQSKRT